MTEQQHPITPPPELVQQWLGEYFGCVVSGELSDSERYLATQAARWGADQELEACVEWASCFNYDDYRYDEVLRDIRRRPKPPSLKEQVRAELDRLIALIPSHGALAMAEPIRRALESLPE